jgi:DNA-binding transcriptional ArsR family regulator
MTDSPARLRNYLTDELEECTDSDVEQRIGDLRSLTDRLDDFEPDVHVFSALANETRYEILRTLDESEDELCVCEINVVMDASEATISQSLSQLVEAGLVSRRKNGRWRKYRVTREATALLATFDGLGIARGERHQG